MNRSGFDRRTDEERRDVYDLNYFENGGAERRRIVERRRNNEMRTGWQRVSQWSSVPVSDFKKDLRMVDSESETGIPTYQIS
jgi:hypothetical protein